MDQLLALIIPPIAGVLTYIVLRLTSKHAEIDVLRYGKRDESGSREALGLRAPSADGRTEPRRVYATLSKSIGMRIVRFGGNSLRGHMPNLMTMYQRNLTKWHRQQRTDIEKKRQIEKRLAATISSAEPNGESAKDPRQNV